MGFGRNVEKLVKEFATELIKPDNVAKIQAVIKNANKNVFALNEVEYIIEDNQATVVGLTEYFAGKLNIPEGIPVDNGKECAVTRIKQSAFSDEDSLRHVKIPEGVKKILKSTFENCANLESVDFPDSLEVIQEKAFAECGKLKYVRTGKNMPYIEESAFDGCDKAILHGPSKGLGEFADENDLYWFSAPCENATVDNWYFVILDELLIEYSYKSSLYDVACDIVNSFNEFYSTHG